ncbi:MAG: N-acetylmuramoyl-L-alanine amidase [Mesorhizobium sp.]|nr:N-acetylmuramoyl-L-alanine amidase [Mesorhizobium sp.]
MYNINKGFLVGGSCKYVATKKMGGILNPRFLIIHYTAGASFESDVRSLSTDVVQSSVHLVIGRSGEIIQIVPFNRVAWHAGESRWGNLSGMNQHSIGIELSNAGLLKRDATGTYRTWWGGSVPAAEVMEAAHAMGGPVHGWHMYTQGQMNALLEVAGFLQSKFNFLDILGHDDVSWPRKTDPGPAFPMGALRSRVLGRN